MFNQGQTNMDFKIEELSLETLESRLELEAVAPSAHTDAWLPIECWCNNN